MFVKSQVLSLNSREKFNMQMNFVKKQKKSSLAGMNAEYKNKENNVLSLSFVIFIFYLSVLRYADERKK